MISVTVCLVHHTVYNVLMTRDRIIAAARAVVEREGISGLTVRKVAAGAGLSPMAMYRHFADKGALLNALMEDGLAAWDDMARALRARDPMEWLDALSEAFLHFALTQPHRFEAAFFLPAPKARQYPDDFVAGRSPVIALAMLRIDQAKANGQLGNRPAVEIALALSATCQGLCSMYRANRFASEKQFKELYRTVVRHCLDSFSLRNTGSHR